MTQNTPPALGEQLLKQNGSAAVDAQIGHLHEIIAAEKQRVDRLSRWARRVWLMLGVLVFLWIVASVFYMTLARADDPTGNNAYPPAVLSGTAGATSSYEQRSVATQILGALLAAAWLLAMFLVPMLLIIGVILTTLTYMARRTAGVNEMRLALASLETQLRLLSSSHKPDKQS